MKEKARDKAELADTISARRASCGYRIQMTCAACRHCLRRGSESAPYRVNARCAYNDFDVNIDRGVCEYFDLAGKYRD